MESKIIIGVDPGTTGAITVMNDNNIVIHDIPTIKVQGIRKKRTEYNCPAYLAIISEVADLYKDKYDIIGVAEKLHAMPINGSVASFSLGRGSMLVEATFSFLNIPYELVSPQTWKKEMLKGFDKKSKDSGRLKAIQLFPKYADLLARKKDIDRAESLLIAEYYRRQCNLK